MNILTFKVVSELRDITAITFWWAMPYKNNTFKGESSA
nr:MAG TPA: hypothetical protein [Caudoviricetes sp.]